MGGGNPVPRLETSIEEKEMVTNRIVETVAAATDTPVTDLPPLFEVIDTDALIALFAHFSERSKRSVDHLSFRYAGCQVTLTGDGAVTVDEPDRSGA